MAQPNGTTQDDRVIVWFDIDNTLYSASSKIADAMGQRIHNYFTGLGLEEEEASVMHLKYYKTYGLALRGLVRHHGVDTLDFDRRCDQTLPLENMIKPNPTLRKLLEDIDRSKARVWALTNAYVVHARRVLKILEIEDLFEGVVYCDYQEKDFFCKPEPEFFHAAMRKAGISDPAKCYFIDDSATNINAACKLNWGHCIHFCEKGLETTEGGVRKMILGTLDLSTTDLGKKSQIDSLEDLREVWSEIFKTE
ncbi:pyrimidine 5-nucleotidase [Pyrrhoderma noxium]|uniref:Pyrimidine 5-nucleotidase n=1 Tax=Pyrrhoderma noxium TaxID=2282107 RepID=A0A286UMR8_9AGAM|nr:pyrimidine 5-nucleotidase [Pyrrhoderma noxium]